MFNKAIEILYLAEICKYMKTPHFCHVLGPTLDTELNVNKYVRMLNDNDTQQDSQSWASLTRWNVTKCNSEVKVNQLKVKNIHVKMGISNFKIHSEKLDYGGP